MFFFDFDQYYWTFWSLTMTFSVLWNFIYKILIGMNLKRGYFMKLPFRNFLSHSQFKNKSDLLELIMPYNFKNWMPTNTAILIYSLPAGYHKLNRAFKLLWCDCISFIIFLFDNKPENPFQTVTSQKFVDILLTYYWYIYCLYIAHILLIYCLYCSYIAYTYMHSQYLFIFNFTMLWNDSNI